MFSSKSMEWLGVVTGQDAKPVEVNDAAIEEKKTSLYTKYELYNQQHVFDHWNQLSKEQKVKLLVQLEQIQIADLIEIVRTAKAEKEGLRTNGLYDLSVETKRSKIKPFSGKVTSTSGSGKYLKKTCYDMGMKAISANKVATILLAGGQGTRLGFDGPKGMYDIGMPSKKTLFCLIAERILKLTQLAEKNGERVSIPLYIMTSPMNHDVTKKYFEENEFFGLPSEDVVFFAQGTLPCMTSEGLIIMESEYQCAMAPDGNGGIYPAMGRCGVLEDMKNRGIEHVHTFAVDNALVKPADPAFIGYCIDERADCGNKVLWKQDPHEKVGVIAERDGKPCIIEYSELSPDMAEQTKGMGRKKLLYGAANICNHYYSIAFLANEVWPNQGKYYHIANKKIPYWDADKKDTVKPTENNGMKLESFIFDVFPLSKKMAILEVEREDEFAPVKNAPGSPSDSPDTARVLLSTLAKKWVKDAGAVFFIKDNGLCEVSPLTSYGGEGLKKYDKKIVQVSFTL